MGGWFEGASGTRAMSSNTKRSSVSGIVKKNNFTRACMIRQATWPAAAAPLAAPRSAPRARASRPPCASGGAADLSTKLTRQYCSSGSLLPAHPLHSPLHARPAQHPSLPVRKVVGVDADHALPSHLVRPAALRPRADLGEGAEALRGRGEGSAGGDILQGIWQSSLQGRGGGRGQSRNAAPSGASPRRTQRVLSRPTPPPRPLATRGPATCPTVCRSPCLSAAAAEKGNRPTLRSFKRQP